MKTPTLVQLLMLWRKYILDDLGRDLHQWQIIVNTVESELKRRETTAQREREALAQQLSELRKI